MFNFNSGHALLWLFRGVELWAYAFLYQHYHWIDAQTLPTWAWAIVGFVAWDLSFYVLHYCHHHHKWLWKIHLVHHTGPYFNLSLGIRNAWYSSLSSLPFFAWMAVVGVPPTVFLVVSVVHYAIQLGNHNQIINRPTVLDRLFITAYSHRVHHANAPIYRNKNFGSCLNIWDKLMGTYQTQQADTPLQYAAAFPTTFNPYHANQWPWYKQRPQSSAIDANSHIDVAWVVVSAVVLFVSVIFYVWHEYHWSFSQQLVWVALFTMATIGLGQYSNGKRHGAGWFLSMLLALMWWLYYLQPWLWSYVLCLMGGHLLYSAMRWMRTQKSVL